MGNRAVIVFDDEHVENKDLCPAIYLQWHGSKYSIDAFLKAGKKLNIRGDDPTYCIARLTQLIGNAIGGTLSIGVGCYGNFGDPGDNGVYWIKNWEIVKHDTDYYQDSHKDKNHDKWFKEAYEEVLFKNKRIFESGYCEK